MSQISKTNKIFLGLESFIILAVLSLGLLAFLPHPVSAATSNKVDAYGTYHGPDYGNYGIGKIPPFESINPPYPPASESNSGVNPAPIIYSIAPNSASSGKGALTATIYGDNFIPSSVAKWSVSSRETTYLDSTHLLMKLTQEDMNGSGKYLVTVFNPAPGGGFSNSVIFTINGGPTSGGTVSNDNSSSTDNNNDSVLSGNALSAHRFFPLSLIQWLFFLILVLIGIVLWRKLYLSDKKKNEPLKHA